MNKPALADRNAGVRDLKTIKFILALMVTLTLCTQALAQSIDPPTPEPVILTDEQGEYPLGLHLEILEDPGGKLTIDQVSSSEFDSQFVPSQAEVPNYGFTDSVYWARLRLDNESRQINEWLLELGFANMQYVDLYTPMPDGEGFTVKQTGSLTPASTRDVLHPRIVFELSAPTQSQQTIYLRFQSGASMTLPLTLWTPDAFLSESQPEQMLDWLFFGAIIALLVYHLFLLFTLREPSYLFFVILLASLIVEELSYNGYLEVYLLPSLYTFKSLYYPLSFSLVIASILLFSDAFLELRIRLPKFHWVIIVLVAGWGVLMLLTPILSYYKLAILAVPWALFSLIAALAAGIVSWRQGSRSAWFFMIAWFGMLASFIMVILVRLGFISSSMFTENGYRLGLMWMAVCWSIALADRINLLKSETETANRALRNSEHKLSQILEGLPLGVVVYGKDQRPTYVNRRTVEILNNPAQGIQVDISVRRSISEAIKDYSFHLVGSGKEYPLENFPVYRALQGEPASADDIEVNLGDKRVPLEIWASPVTDDAGKVESAVAAFQDISQRKQAEAELIEYHKRLESLVEKRTAELTAANEQLNLRVDWLSAINQVNQIMASSADFRQIYDRIIEIINGLFSTQDAFIAELNEGSRQLIILAHSCRSDLHPVLVGSVTSFPETFLSTPNIQQGALTSYSKDELSPLTGPIGMHMQISPIQSIALVPLRLRESFFGFLGLEIHDKDRIITSDEISLLSFFSIDIAQLFEDRRLFEQAKAAITAEERNRLARDLHDSVTQVLFSANLLAEVLPQIWRRDPEQGLQRLEKLQRLTRGALAEMRTMLLELRPTAVINTPLSELLAQLAEAVTSRSGVPFQLFIAQIPSLPEDVQFNYYRIAEEALNNVVKHAQAKQVTLSLSSTPLPPDSTGAARHAVRLVIEDDGVGYSSGKRMPEQLGIGIMRERAAAIQADFSLDSQPGYGTQLTLIWSNASGSDNG